MQDFFCENPKQMNYKELAERADYLGLRIALLLDLLSPLVPKPRDLARTLHQLELQHHRTAREKDQDVAPSPVRRNLPLSGNPRPTQEHQKQGTVQGLVLSGEILVGNAGQRGVVQLDRPLDIPILERTPETGAQGREALHTIDVVQVQARDGLKDGKSRLPIITKGRRAAIRR